ncbi:MAG: EAL domain-containing protein [Glaciecola sp.]
MQSSSLKRLYITLFAIIATSTLVMLTVYTMKLIGEHQQTRFSHEVLRLVNNVADETKSNLALLNQAVDLGFCNDQKIRAMRQFVFKSRYAKEIGYYSNDTYLCNTNLGDAQQAQLAMQPDIITPTGHELWLNTASNLFEEEYPIYIIKSGDYHIVLDPNEIMSVDMPEFEWQWLYKDKQQTVSLLGTPELHKYASDRRFYDIDTSFVLVCSEGAVYCIASRDYLSRQFSIPIILAIVMGVIMALCAFYWLGHLILSYYYCHHMRIKRGLKNRAFYPLYQPIIELETGKIIGCEVLARFKDDLGILSPAEFIPIVLQQHKTVEFTRIILKVAMSQLVKQVNLPAAFKVNFNVFPNDLTKNNFERISRHKDLFSSRFQLCFEITEDEPFKNDTATNALKKLKETGAEVAIDDFGTGYSNLTQLQSIPFDYLKMDKSFCIGLERSAFRASLIPQIVKIADMLDVPVVAEGVETNTQRKILIREGVKLAQGFFFSRPISANRLGNLVLMQASV